MRTSLSRREVEVLLYVQQHGEMTAAELAKHFNFTRVAAHGHLIRLMDKGRLQRREVIYNIGKKLDGLRYIYSPVKFSGISEEGIRSFTAQLGR